MVDVTVKRSDPLLPLPNGVVVPVSDAVPTADVWASAFNPIIAAGFHGAALYLTDYGTQGSGYATGDVVRVQLNADGTAGTRTTLGAGALYQLNGLAFGENGKVYVSNHSISSGGGQVVRVNY